jgi:hypothetical protein
MKEDRDPIWILGVHRKMFRVFVEMLFFTTKVKRRAYILSSI